MNSIEHFIDGKIVKGSSKRTGKVFNPSTGEISSNVNLANTLDLNKAVEAAKKAFQSWSVKTPLFRARILFKFKELIEKNYDKGFAISDHADWEGILEVVKKSEAKNVFFHHGDSEALSKYLVEKESINVLFFHK